MKGVSMWVITWVAIISIAAFLIAEYGNRPKTGYIVIQEVYARFDLKKELEKKFELTKNTRQKVLDSLAFELKMLAKKIDSEKGKNREDEISYNRKREEFYQRRQTFSEDNDQLSRQYDQEILSQLNQYVSDYGKENNYKYIFGNDGNGSLMHAEESENITKEIIEFINKKYRGVK